MCPGLCARCVSTLLLSLALISTAASVLLLFPNGERDTSAGKPGCCLDCGAAASRTENYLHNPLLWTICERPKNVVLWHVTLFCTLMIISCLQVLLCSIQIFNGCLGCIFGRCSHYDTK
ncbi:transmembrane 4 L6 family member 5-like [Hemiscyllium ocellatum]|uniref:transmembrane 4 L6 family member 5-like n=1 Tax=Hemiscyllium ocellatum TaxID=170820 RepID=UPI002965F8BA|nr:transmembrane 4 L6 family member 5-like [Hemiscyllium ocellatum]